MVVAAFALAVPGTIEAGNAVDATAQAVSFGLASLRVPLESGGVDGTFAPLTGLLLTLWGLASATRRAAGRWPGPLPHVIATGGAFALVCAAAAAAAGLGTSIEPSIGAAALAGLTWGSVGAALGRYAATRVRPTGAGRASRWLRFGPPGLAPGILTATVAAGLAAALFLGIALVGLGGGSPREIAGGLLLALAVAPNAAAALVAVGLGAAVSVVVDGTLLVDPLRESLSLWDGEPYLIALVLVPLVATVVGGRSASAALLEAPALIRGLRNGAVLGAVLMLAGWAGSLEATAAPAGDRVSVRLGFPGVVTFALAVVWGIAGAHLGPRLPWPRRGSRVGDP